MRLGDILWGMGILILVYLLLTNWEGANQLIATIIGGTSTIAKTLQGR